MKYIFIFFLIIALIWGGWKYIYTPYQIKKSAERQLVSQEAAAKNQLALQIAKADFSVIVPVPPKGYYLIANSSLSRLRDAAAEYYKSQIVSFDYQNANGIILTINEKLSKNGEAAKSFSGDKERWDSAHETKLTNGAIAYSARKIVKQSIALPRGSAFNFTIETAAVRFKIDEMLIDIETTNASSSGGKNLLSDKELVQFANAFIKPQK